MSVSGWIGVDLDGTLAQYGGWNGGEIGDPIAAMVDRVKCWRLLGIAVKVVTARASAPELIEPIERWCEKHIGEVLPVTDRKDFAMIELWDDRCVAVEANTGRQLSPSQA